MSNTPVFCVSLFKFIKNINWPMETNAFWVLYPLRFTWWTDHIGVGGIFSPGNKNSSGTVLGIPIGGNILLYSAVSAGSETLSSEISKIKNSPLFLIIEKLQTTDWSWQKLTLWTWRNPKVPAFWAAECVSTAWRVNSPWLTRQVEQRPRKQQ